MADPLKTLFGCNLPCVCSPDGSNYREEINSSHRDFVTNKKVSYDMRN